MIKDSALDRLFPESMRYHKGHVADPDIKVGLAPALDSYG